MKQETLNYEAEISCCNGAWAKFFFHADSATLARDHVQHIVNCDDVVGFDWNKHPGQIHYIHYRKKGNIRGGKFIYNPKPFPRNEKNLGIGDYIKINTVMVEALKEVSEWFKGLDSSPYYSPGQKAALRGVNEALIQWNVAKAPTEPEQVDN